MQLSSEGVVEGEAMGEGVPKRDSVGDGDFVGTSTG